MTPVVPFSGAWANMPSRTPSLAKGRIRAAKRPGQETAAGIAGDPSLIGAAAVEQRDDRG